MTDTPMVSRRTWESLHMDERIALKRAAANLADEFGGIYGAETIERFLASSFDQFSSRSTITKFLPLLAERFARQRLRALAKVQGLRDDGLPVVLFLARTTRAGRRWPWASSRRLRVIEPSGGRAGRSPASR